MFLLPDDGRLDSNGDPLVGRIVACGISRLHTENSPMTSDGFVLRLMPDGDADATYTATGMPTGISELMTPGVSENIFGFAVDPDGNYVICGASGSDFLLARYCK